MVSRKVLGAVALAALAGLSSARPAEAKVQVVVDLATQRMSVTTGSGERREWPVSTARSGYETPTGTFSPLRMEREHFSREWDDAPMPNSIFFTARGHAIHGSEHVASLGRPASHGCIRLARANAATLFAWVRSEGATITVTGAPPGPPPPATRRVPAREGADLGGGYDEGWGEGARYDGPADDPAPRAWRRAKGRDGFGGDAPTGW